MVPSWRLILGSIVQTMMPGSPYSCSPSTSLKSRTLSTLLPIGGSNLQAMNMMYFLLMFGTLTMPGFDSLPLICIFGLCEYSEQSSSQITLPHWATNRARLSLDRDISWILRKSGKLQHSATLHNTWFRGTVVIQIINQQVFVDNSPYLWNEQCKKRYTMR